MAIKLITSASELTSALAAARGGETFVLADGDYGSLVYKNVPALDTTVTITALNPGKATFNALEFYGAENLVLDGLELTGGLKLWSGCENITVRNSAMVSFWVRASDNVTVENNDIGGGRFGVNVQASTNVTMSQNYIHDVTEDLMRVTGSTSDLLIENNLFFDTIAKAGTHSDLIQMYGEADGNPHDIVVRGNILYDDPTTGKNNSQGIFMSDPVTGGYSNITIEQNLIWVQQPNTIYLSGGGPGIVIRDNSLIGQTGGWGAQVRLVNNSKGTGEGVLVEGNVLRSVLDEIGNSTKVDNHFFSSGKYSYVSGKLTDLFQSAGYDGWKGFLPVAGSAIDFGSPYGAQERLLELLAGKDNDFGATRMVFEKAGDLSLKGNSGSWYGYDHDAALALDEATIALSFDMNTTSGTRAILSKDSAGLHDGLTVSVQNGTLMISFEDDTGVQTLSKAGVTENASHDLVISFEDGKGQAWLDGGLVGSVETGMDWSDNTDKLLIGASNDTSPEGTTSRKSAFFTGTIGDIRIYDEGMTGAQAAAVIAQEKALDAGILGGVGEKTALYLGGRQIFNSKVSDAVIIDHDKALEITEGTMVFNFTPDATGYKKGVLSKDSAGLDNGLSIMFDQGALKIQFEDDSGIQTIVKSGLSRFVDYSMVISWEEGQARAWIDGQLIGSVATDMDWSGNTDKLVLGARNFSSAPGTTSALNTAYDGMINGFLVISEGMTAAEAYDYIDSHPLLLI